MMKIAVVNHGIFPTLMGGMERHTHFLSNELAKLGADVDVLVPHMESKHVVKDNFEILYNLHFFPWPNTWPWLRANFQFSKSVRNYLVSRQYDAVYCQGLSAWAYLATKKTQRRQARFFNPHGLEMFKTIGIAQNLKSAPFRWAAARQAKLADSVISLGGGMTNEIKKFLNVDEKKIDVLPNAVDLDYVDGLLMKSNRKANGNVFTFVGRLEFNKGIQFLCDAINCVEGTQLNVVGSGPLEATLRERYEGSNIKFHGRVDDENLFSLYKDSDAFVFSSLYEGMPTVILEAMAASLPIISTEIGAVNTMVNNRNGFLVAPQSAPALAEAIVAFRNLSKSERFAMGQASREKVVSCFTWPEIGKATLSAIQRRLNEI